jgi:DNA-binding transcriptional MerR regulator
LTSFTPEQRDADEPRYTVRVVAERVGVPTATLRSWNQRYGVGPPEHTPGRHRLYSENDIAIVQQMHELIAQGASPRSAARTAIDSVRPVRGDHDALLSAAFALDITTVGQLLERHLRHFGVLDTWEELVRPAFTEIERRQAQGVDCIDVEHLLSWTVSRSLQRMPIAPIESSSIILACTSRETHSLAIEALRAALGERGRGTLMLGADVPQTALVDAAERGVQPVHMLLWSQTADTADSDTVKTLVTHACVTVAGRGWDGAQLPDGVRLLSSLSDAVDHLLLDIRR